MRATRRREMRRVLSRSEEIGHVVDVSDPIAEYWDRPVDFMRALVDPETGEPFEVYEAEDRFLEHALTLQDDGTLPCPELVFSAPKKSGKTALAAVALLYVVRVIGGRYAEGYACANDFDQAQGRVWKACQRIIEASSLLQGTAEILTGKGVITFPATGGTITALPADYAGAAGANPSIVVFDELWAYISESGRRLWDEMVPVPTRKVSVRLTVTYAGFEGESDLLEELWERGKKGEEISPAMYRTDRLLMFWTHRPVAPWQTDAWLEQMRDQLRPTAYTRMIENRFTSGESGFVEMDWWDACVDQGLRPVVSDPTLPVFVGVDASVKRDATAIVAVTWDWTEQKVRLLRHRIFQPSPDEPLDFEATVEETVLELARAFPVYAVRYDPYQLVSSAQRLVKGGIPMEEYPQTVDRLTAASSNLYELVKGGNLWVYPDPDVRLAISRAVAVETSRGWRIAKTKTSHKIDVVVALAMASLACVEACAGGFLGDEVDEVVEGFVV